MADWPFRKGSLTVPFDVADFDQSRFSVIPDDGNRRGTDDGSAGTPAERPFDFAGDADQAGVTVRMVRMAVTVSMSRTMSVTMTIPVIVVVAVAVSMAVAMSVTMTMFVIVVMTVAVSMTVSVAVSMSVVVVEM